MSCTWLGCVLCHCRFYPTETDLRLTNIPSAGVFSNLNSNRKLQSRRGLVEEVCSPDVQERAWLFFSRSSLLRKALRQPLRSYLWLIWEFQVWLGLAKTEQLGSCILSLGFQRSWPQPANAKGCNLSDQDCRGRPSLFNLQGNELHQCCLQSTYLGLHSH